MRRQAGSISVIESDNLEFVPQSRVESTSCNEHADSSKSTRLGFSFSCIGFFTHSFFKQKRVNGCFPDSYLKLWGTLDRRANLRKLQALLVDYTKEDCLLGSTIGRIISGHWRRHHVQSVSKIIAKMSLPNHYESVEQVVADLKALKPKKGGSLYQRIQFIERKLEEQLQSYYFKNDR